MLALGRQAISCERPGHGLYCSLASQQRNVLRGPRAKERRTVQGREADKNTKDMQGTEAKMKERKSDETDKGKSAFQRVEAGRGFRTLRASRQDTLKGPLVKQGKAGLLPFTADFFAAAFVGVQGSPLWGSKACLYGGPRLASKGVQGSPV